jgi:hypothetical protein
MTDEMLSAAQRQALAAYAGIDRPDAVDDAALLEAVADRIGMTGELSIDPAGVVELMRGDILVALEAVADEDHELVEHPDQLQLAVFLRAAPGARAELEQAGLLDAEDDDTFDDNWSYAPWGAMCTRLARDAGLPVQMEALERAMAEAEAAVEGRDAAAFQQRLAALQHDG